MRQADVVTSKASGFVRLRTPGISPIRSSWQANEIKRSRVVDKTLHEALLECSLLHNFITAFSATTGILLHSLDLENVEIEMLEVLRQHPFCALLANTEPGRRRCLERLRDLAAEVTSHGIAKKSASICRFTYFGVPLRAHGTIVGILLAGPIFRRTPSPTDWTRTLHHTSMSGLPLGLSSAKDAYFSIPVVFPSRLEGMIGLLSIISERVSEFAARSLILTTESEPRCVALAKEFIRQNSAGPLTVTDIARRVSLHPDYFGKLFRKATRMTLTEYIGRVRVENVKERLAKASCRVAEAAFAAGFQSLAQFNRDFKKYGGVCPTQYMHASVRNVQSLV